MERCAFVGALGMLAVLLAPAAFVWAEVPIVGVLGNQPPESGRAYTAKVRQALKELGHEEGRTFRLEERWAAGDITRYPAFADELLALRPAMMLAPCGGPLDAVRQISRSIPVVSGCTDPQNYRGEVASLNRPGGQTTGFVLLAPESAGKRLQLLKEVLPTLSRLAVLYNAGANWSNYFPEAERAARQLGIVLVKAPHYLYAADLEASFPFAVHMRAQAVMIVPDTVSLGARPRIAELALKHRLPTLFETRFYVEDGGLLSYGPNWIAFGSQVIATYVDKILKGVRPGDLPIQRPTKFELVINLKTAKALGLTIPPSLLQRADLVIE